MSRRSEQPRQPHERLRRTEGRLPQPRARPAALCLWRRRRLPAGRAGDRHPGPAPGGDGQLWRAPRAGRRPQLGLWQRQSLPARRDRAGPGPLQGHRRGGQRCRAATSSSVCRPPAWSAWPSMPRSTASTITPARPGCCACWPSWACSYRSRSKATSCWPWHHCCSTAVPGSWSTTAAGRRRRRVCRSRDSRRCWRWRDAAAPRSSCRVCRNFRPRKRRTDDALPFVSALVDAFTLDACLWGSDWPFLKATQRLDYGPLLRLVERWFPAAADRQRLLWDTPRRLFGFGA